MKHTPLPWRECGSARGGCKCCQIWSTTADHPVCNVVIGKWGDDYPSLRFVDNTGGEGSLNPQIEAYMGQITYGEVPEEIGKANAAYIVQACNSFHDLLEALKDMVDTFSGYQGMQLTKARAAIVKATSDK